MFVCEAVAICVGCQNEFEPSNYKAQKFCTPKCYRTVKRRESIQKRFRQCETWYNLFLVNEASDPGYRCSKSCKEPKQKAIHINTCVVCGSKFEHDRNKKYCSYGCSYKVNSLIPAEKRVCKGCSIEFIAGAGTNRMYYCSLQCTKRTTRAARKARIRSVTVIPFDPISVLERDGWHCYICGVDTPKILRGTYEANAPELDHVVALANGGAHSTDNTACACRRCNNMKAANDNYKQELIAA